VPSDVATQEQPKPPRSAFICFKDYKKEEIMKKKGITKDNDDLLKVFADAWKELSDKERAYWDEEARNDKVRFVTEKKGYTGPSNQKKTRAKKDPNAPKRPMSAFLKFSKTRRKTVKEENPSVSNTDVSRLLGEIWRNSSDAEKAPYVEAEIIEREKYKEEMRKFREEKSQLDAALRTSHEQASQIFRQNQHEQQTVAKQSQRYPGTSAFDPHRENIPTIGAHFERLNIEPLVEEESSAKRSAFNPHVPNHYHRPQHPGHDYFMSDSHNQHSWPDISLQHSMDHDSDPLPVVPRMPPSLQVTKAANEEYNGGHQSNRSFYFPDNSHHFPRYP
jgi:high mobility group protein B1